MKKWFKDLGFYGKVLSTLSIVGMIFTPHTVAYKGGVACGAVGGLLMWLRGEYQNDNLKNKNILLQKTDQLMDKMPNKITGVKNVKVD